MTTDPFSDPAPIASEFASADSLRGRVVLIEPTKLELDLPNQLSPGQKQDRVTATVTVLDGKGPVQVYAQKVPTGVWLEGPVHSGVWFSQDRVVRALFPKRVFTPGVRVLGRLETFKPGKPAGAGNPWGIVALTPEEKTAAIQAHSQITIGGASAPQATTPDANENPFA